MPETNPPEANNHAGAPPVAAPVAAPVVRRYNRVRFDIYLRCAHEFVDGETYDANELAHMLHDIRWDEVPRAFAVALHNAAKRGPLRESLGAEFARLLEYVVFLGFGSTDRNVVQPWFLKNWDDFFVACVDGLLSLNNRSDAHVKKHEESLRRAFRGVLTLIDGARKYMSLDRLAGSSAVHALLVAAGHARTCFLKNGFVQMGGNMNGIHDVEMKRKLTLAHVVLMDEVAQAILDTCDVEVITWERAFGHYAGAVKWRSFAMRCKLYCVLPGMMAPAVVMLERQVEDAFVRGRREAALVAASADAAERIMEETLRRETRERSATANNHNKRT